MARIPNYAPPGSLLDKRSKHRRVVPDGPGQREPREVDEGHLAAIRLLCCCRCGRMPAEAAHIRYGDRAHGERSFGIGEKPHDRRAVPLCAECHRDGRDAQHRNGERKWWRRQGIDPHALAAKLYAVSPDHDAMMKIVQETRP